MQELFDTFAASWSSSLPSFRDALFHLVLTFVLVTPLAWVYVHTHRGPSYSQSFVQSLILLAMIVTIVMLAIGDSMARAFGLLGALALIRFRTPIKDSRDTVFLFLSVGIGITVGVQNPLLAVAGTTCALAVALYLNAVRFGERASQDGMLRFRMPAQGEQDALLRRVLTHYCRTFALAQLRDAPGEGELEFAYRLRLHDANQAQGLVADVRAIPGAFAVTLVVQDEHEEV